MITLPNRLKELLASDNKLNAFVLKAMTVIEPWARDNKTVFFQDYTDHSLLHLVEVLNSADSIISDQSWKHLTPEDAAVVAMAVLLHDCALHISEDGFYSLIEGRYIAEDSRYAKHDVSWVTLWDEFLVESRRFDQRKLISLFGDTDPVGAFPANKLNLTLRHRLLAGEFLRRHHARLAHEIALVGIPGPGNPFPIADPEHRDLLDLAGYVARSHNIPIRAAVDNIEPAKRRVHLNCRVPFVMVVLRIADYIQLHSSRAPGQLLRLKSLAWAAAGFKDTLLRWKMKPEVVYGEKKDIQPRVQARGGQAGHRAWGDGGSSGQGPGCARERVAQMGSRVA